jgi:hypothetical protein
LYLKGEKIKKSTKRDSEGEKEWQLRFWFYISIEVSNYYFIYLYFDLIHKLNLTAVKVQLRQELSPIN